MTPPLPSPLRALALRVFAHLRDSVVRRSRRLRASLVHTPRSVRGVVTLLALAALVFVLTRTVLAPRDPVWARIRSTGTWRVALDPSFPPFENVGADGRIAGLDPDLAAAIAVRWGVRLELVSLGFDELMDAVAAHKVDSAVSALPVVPHRTEDVHFSDPYVDAGLVLVVSPGSPVQAASDLAGRRLAAEWGSAGDAEARSQRERIRTAGAGDVHLVLRDSMAAALDATVEGEADAAIVDAITFALYSRRDRLHVAGHLTHDPYVVVIPARAHQLEDEINAALRSLESDGTLDEIRNRWLRP